MRKRSGICSRESIDDPLLRDWIPWLYRKMKERGVIVQLDQSGCQAGLLLADNDTLDALVGEGTRNAI